MMILLEFPSKDYEHVTVSYLLITHQIFQTIKKILSVLLFLLLPIFLSLHSRSLPGCVVIGSFSISIVLPLLALLCPRDQIPPSLQQH